jgi:hypothetical protein
MRKMSRLIGLVVAGVAFSVMCCPQSASALDTPNTLMVIDGMTLNHAGLFRSADPADGFNTF